jgi:hypothetical protein
MLMLLMLLVNERESTEMFPSHVAIEAHVLCHNLLGELHSLLMVGASLPNGQTRLKDSLLVLDPAGSGQGSRASWSCGFHPRSLRSVLMVADCEVNHDTFR